MKSNPVRWFEIYVEDMARAMSFYEDVLQVRLEKLSGPDIEMWSFPARQEQFGSGGALVHMPGFPAGGNSILVYFASEDCAVEAARIVPAGGRIHRDKMSIGQYGFVVLALDTEGNMFGVHSMR